MFRDLTIRGSSGALLYGHLEAVTLRSWEIRRERDTKRDGWVLDAQVRTRHPVWSRSKPLLFTAPRLGGGRWCWPIRELDRLDAYAVSARLGKPEQ